jgi:hypothetical protein
MRPRHGALHAAPFSSTSLWIDTMNRCNEFLARLTLAACAALAAGSLILPIPASAQGIQREAPKDVVLGKLVVTAPPEVLLDGKPDRLSPGSRIRDLNNMLVLSGNVVGKALPVVYRRDAAGLVHEAWILTDEEYSKLGGAAAGGADGHKRFAELLAVIFGARR